MKKILLLIAAVSVLFTACNNDCDHTFDDHSADLVGTWTCLTADFAEALVISADGKMVSTGVAGGEYWENVNGTVTIKENKITLSFEDGDNFEGHFDIIPGVAFSLYNEEGGRFVFNYCKEDLSDEILGMWVCNYSETDIRIQTYNADGTTITTGMVSPSEGIYMLNSETTYKVVGDLLFTKMVDQLVSPGSGTHHASRMVYAPNGTSSGDIMSLLHYVPTENGYINITNSRLRIKQTLDLAGKKYDYIKTFVTNVKGLDKDIEFLGHTFNFAKMDNTMFDKMLKNLLFAVEFPDANTIKYNLYYNNKLVALDLPIVVEGNKMTVKMSEVYSAAKDVDLYTFQDADCSQMHMYMPTYSFINFFGNMQIAIMTQFGQLDANDTAAVKAVFDSIDEAVNTINVSFVMTKAAK